MILLLISCNPDIEEKKIEGYYCFDQIDSYYGGGCIEIIEHYDRKISIYQERHDQFVSENFNETLCSHPLINIKKIEYGRKIGENVYYRKENDIEKDGSNENLSEDRHYTIYHLYEKNDIFYFEIQIYSGSDRKSGGINEILVNRKFKESK